MALIESNIVTSSESFCRNREAMLTLLQRVRGVEASTREVSNAAGPRFRERGQLLPHERLGLLLDRNAPFLELSTLAGYGMGRKRSDGKAVAGGGLIAGIGAVSGVRCMVCVSDSGIDAGAFQPKGLEKQLRIQEIALENKLPFVQLVESAGANLLNYEVQSFVHGGQKFRNLARLSAAGLPIVTITHGASTAGGAYQTGLSDYIIMVENRSRAFLAGPSLLEAATGEIATEEELGGGLMHATISGLADYLAQDDRDAIRLAREVLESLHWNKRRQVPHAVEFEPPRYDGGELLGIMPEDYRQPVDMREVIARIVDGSLFREFSALYGPATVCGHAFIKGYSVGIITNNGPIDPAGAAKVTHFIQACCQADMPLIYLNNTTGFMVGKSFEERGSIKHGSKMIQAIANANVPQITVFCGASFGAGNYAMCGRGFHPRFCFSWPNAKTAVMGPEQAAETMTTVNRAAMLRRYGEADEAKLKELHDKVVANFMRQMDVFTTSAHVLDDGVIDPRDTRNVLAQTLEICRDADMRQVNPMQFGVSRP
ncbi:acyl-CoA carboxylase subunit beta [Paralcaligenes sp. KSB-10]|uniref:acyl-CoA carboxylase subunit beta n=1 Tax=Paralcaligenes sp. KSB-10 TaxID=2901142 RepID=UPI001E5CD195|nr:carboxyl transferase domain-containing protein [Paralcaligenes sp. KSB-10]UHL66439.1 acyl-CoA carboxylase subunit beta [Paralcaligenes sp. KSB-10]